MSDRPQDPTSLELLVRIADALEALVQLKRDELDPIKSLERQGVKDDALYQRHLHETGRRA